jgi:hypothetical protein
MPKVRRCNRTGKVIFATELEAKIALAWRVWKDKGEKRWYPCHGHFHLTSEDKREAQHGAA